MVIRLVLALWKYWIHRWFSKLVHHLQSDCLHPTFDSTLSSGEKSSGDRIVDFVFQSAKFARSIEQPHAAWNPSCGSLLVIQRIPLRWMITDRSKKRFLPRIHRSQRCRCDKRWLANQVIGNKQYQRNSLALLSKLCLSRSAWSYSIWIR